MRSAAVMAGCATRFAIAIAAASLLSSCGSHGKRCVDNDMDGYGAGCALGPDCDDTNPLRTDNCATVPPPDCTADPSATGCPCIGGLVPCYPGPAGTEGVGLCAAGRELCIGEHWGLCEGAVVPTAEVCDGLDQNCDGVADDGVLSPCGGCNPQCIGGVWGEGDAPFVSGSGTAVLPDGELTLAREPPSAPSVWVPNTGDDTLSRIDVATATEVARYDTGGSEPSRVAVDYDGDAWVTNRALGGQSTVTKVISDPSRCPDRNNDGSVQTSTGPTDVLPRGQDECVAFTVPVGQPGDVARAIAVDGERSTDGTLGGNVWVGLEQAQAIVELDGRTGAEIDRVDTPGFAPFDATFDPWGVLWMISQDGWIARVDRSVQPLHADLTEVPYPCYLLYGVASDPVGRLLMTGFSCDQVLVYDPGAGSWAAVPTPQSPRGVAVSTDGLAWVAHADGRLSELTVDPPALDATYDLTALGFTPLESIGAGLDAMGGVWVESSQGGTAGMGVVTRVDEQTGDVTDQVTVGLRPHGQGDMTGAALASFVPQGTASYIFDGCPAPAMTQWVALHLDADAGTSGTVTVELRHAATRADLAAASFDAVLTFPAQTPPVDLTLPDGGVVEVRVTLATADRDGAPRVRDVGLEWQCGGLG